MVIKLDTKLWTKIKYLIILFECIYILVDIKEDTMLLEYNSQYILPLHAVISK